MVGWLVDTNKGGSLSIEDILIRSRLVAMNSKGKAKDRDDLFAGTLPLEARSRAETMEGRGSYYLWTLARLNQIHIVKMMFTLNYLKNANAQMNAIKMVDICLLIRINGWRDKTMYMTRSMLISMIRNTDTSLEKEDKKPAKRHIELGRHLSALIAYSPR